MLVSESNIGRCNNYHPKPERGEKKLSNEPCYFLRGYVHQNVKKGIGR